jgi:putative transposase
VSTVTDAVVDEVQAWQSRPLEAVWPIVYLDALALLSQITGREPYATA